MMNTSSELSTVLEKLAHDDAFRERMLGDPVGALASLGITLRADQVPSVRSLPSKESILADQTALQSTLENTTRMVPFLLTGAMAGLRLAA
ncbi:NHLP-related RiPP peptide [Duganella aceris]|jgi:putative modified peptide|uniref:Modified peptide n=1 Tax=Duganella aceris TaxID=2703883 RepID=A0ABX0FGM5_9BURK|nr:NHLP-related RiPP peptide [Duganella aceris]NGZ83713.1 putative modified peptide [Duganella aceris]